jgi:hypothetical protein
MASPSQVRRENGKVALSILSAPLFKVKHLKGSLLLLVQEITVTPVDVRRRMTRIQILWRSGVVTETATERRRTSANPRCPQQMPAQGIRTASEGITAWRAGCSNALGFGRKRARALARPDL